MFYEKLQDGILIVHSIAHKPITTKRNDLTLLDTAISFDETGTPAYYLQNIMEPLVGYTDPAELLIKDLQQLYL